MWSEVAHREPSRVVGREMWADLVCATFVELDCDFRAAENFHGRIEHHLVGEFDLAKVSSTTQLATRTRSRIARSSHDDFLLNLQTSGRGEIRQGGRSALLKPGDIGLYDTTRPYELCFDDDFSTIVLRIPRKVIEQKIVDTDQLTAKPITCARGMGRLASNFLCQVFEQIDDLDPLSLPRVYSGAIELLTGAMLEQSGGSADVKEAHILLRRRTIAYIDRNLADPALSCRTIAGALRISTRHLRQIFETAPYGVSDLIWVRRLEQARRDLADPFKAHISVTGIGFDLGFKDSAHFSRAFKNAFDVTPSSFRAAALDALQAGGPPHSAMNKRPRLRGQDDGQLPS